MSEQIDDVVDVEADEVVDGVVDEEVDDSAAGDDGGDDDTLGAPSLAAAIEALLLLADEPMSVMDLAAATRQPADEVEAVVRALSKEYTEQMRGFDLREVAGGWRYYSRTECSPVVERFVLDGQQARMTQASLETLAVIAYRQPIARGRVAAVRGVNVDGAIPHPARARAHRGGRARRRVGRPPLPHDVALPRAHGHRVARRPSAARRAPSRPRGPRGCLRFPSDRRVMQHHG